MNFSAAAAGVSAAFLMTLLGASFVFLFKSCPFDTYIGRIFSGFAAGVMLSALIFSLLLPALNMTSPGAAGAAPVLCGFAAGGGLLFLLDIWPGGNEHRRLRPAHRMLLAVGLHNIPQGMAAALTCAMAAQPLSGVSAALAASLCIGLALQSLPEGMALSVGLRSTGSTAAASFAMTAAAAVIEPAAGLLAVLAAESITSALPWLLSLSAGAMLYILADDFIPCAAGGTHEGTAACLGGFSLMLFLHAALGS